MTKKPEAESGVAELLLQALVPEEEQPYKVQANWVWVKMSEIGSWGSGGTPSRRNPEYYQGDIMWFKTGELNDSFLYSSEERITEFAVQNSSTKIFPAGTILVAMYGATIGRTAILGIDASTNQACAAIVPNNELISQKHLFYYLQSQKDKFIALGKGGAQPNISQTVLKEYPLPLPPLPEQQRIVLTIESLFAKLDRARELLEEVQDAFEEQKATILSRAFRGEMTAGWREKRGLSIETVWKRREIKDICKLSSGGTPSRALSEYYSGNIPWIKTGEINWNYIFDSEEKISQEALKNSSAKLFPEGTVLLAMYGQGLTRGRAAILSIDAATNQAVCGLLPNAELNNKYLFYFFMNNYWELREKAVGGNQPNFSMTIVGGFEIEVPPLSEQVEIVHILDDLLDKTSAAASLCDQMEQIDQLKKTILAKAFRGELDTNDPAEESAEKLLRKVLRQRAAVGAGKSKVKRMPLDGKT